MLPAPARLTQLLWPGLVVLVALAWPLPYVAPIRPPNELSHVFQARAIVVDHTLAIDGVMARHGPVGDLSVFRGRHYPNKAPGVSLLGAGVLAAWATLTGRPLRSIPVAETLFVLEKTLCALPTLLLLPFIRRYLRRFTDNRWAVDLVTIGFALGSLALVYSLVLYSHELAAMLLFGGFLAYVAAADRDQDAFVVLGALMSGTALLCEYTVAPAVLVTAGYALVAGIPRRPGDRVKRALRRAAFGIAGAALPVGLLLWYQQAAFGSALSTGYNHVASPALAAIHAKGLLGVQAPHLSWLLISLFGPGKGLLYFSPWLALAAPGLWLAWKRPRRGFEVLAAGGVVLFYLVFTACWDASVWGWTVGPRHLTPMVPFLLAPAAAAASWLRDRPGRRGPRLAGIASGAVACAVVLYVASALVYPHYPPELDGGPFQIAFPLLAKGYAALNAGAFLFHRAGPWTDLPVFLAALAAIAAALALWPGRASARGRLESAGIGVAVCVVLLATGALAARSPRAPGTRQFVIEHYAPKPGDRPSWPPGPPAIGP